jgi:hypothetical protein
MSDTGSAFKIGFLCCAFIAAPFLTVTFPPITDLPQQTAQIKLLQLWMSDPAGSSYRLQWYNPGTLAYGFLGLCYWLFGPLHAGRIAMAVVCALWVGGIHFLAHEQRRSSASAGLASVLVLNHCVYWGFYGFVLGFPVFVGWMSLLRRSSAGDLPVRTGLLLFVAALLLYLSHVLWLIMGLVWLGVRSLYWRVPMSRVARCLGYVLPVLVLVAVWFWSFSTSSMATLPLWVTAPWERLRPSWILNAALGGLRGWIEYAALVAIALWMTVGMIQHRKQFKSSADLELLLAGGMMLGLALVLPDSWMRTLHFSSRWVPAAVVFLVIGTPAPGLPRMVRRSIAVGFVGIFCLYTVSVWLLFERVELAGLRRGLEAIPESSRVVGLDLAIESLFVKGRPFIQIPAYAQLVKDATLNFSFAELSSCLVVHKPGYVPPWTQGLEWIPFMIRYADLDYFDVALVNGGSVAHNFMASRPGFVQLTQRGRWRVYTLDRAMIPADDRNSLVFKPERPDQFPLRPEDRVRQP